MVFPPKSPNAAISRPTPGVFRPTHRPRTHRHTATPHSPPFPPIRPLFPALRSGPTARSGAYPKSKFLAAILDLETSGIKYRLNLEDNVTDLRIFTSANRYDRSEIDHLKSACENGVFIDVGANIGFYSLQVAKTASLVIAIEPNPTAIKRLRYNIEINEFAKNIKVVPCGVGTKGEFELYSSGDLGSASMLPSSDNTESIVISTQPLLDTIQENQVTGIAGLKIDIEGLEDQVLYPFFEQAPKNLWPSCIVIAHCHQSEWDTDIISHLLTLKYKITFQSRSNTVLKISSPLERT